MPTDTATIFSPCHCAVLRKASRQLSRAYDNALAPAGLKTTQFSLLAAVERAGERKPTLQELAEVMVMDRSNLGHNLRPLERKGWVRLEKNLQDARSRYVAITDSGKNKLCEARVFWNRMQAQFETIFGQKFTEDLRASLLQLAATPL